MTQTPQTCKCAHAHNIFNPLTSANPVCACSNQEGVDAAPHQQLRIPLILSLSPSHRADSVYEDMKQRYGAQGCYLLKVNSRTAAAGADEQIPDPWSQYLHKSSLQSQVQLGPRLSVPSIYLLMYSSIQPTVPLSSSLGHIVLRRKKKMNVGYWTSSA